MKRFTLTTKISILAGLAIIVASVSVATFATRVTSSEITDLTMNNIATTEYGVIDILDNWRATLEVSTLVLADKTRLVTALSNNDFDTVESLTEAQMEVLDLETLLVTDENGLVVGGGKRGVNLASSRAVSGALRGSITNAYERTELCDYSQLVAYPIKNNGKVVGTVVGGYSLITDEFVNEIKEYFEVECTIFEGSTRRATTLGSKYVGTTLANQTIVDLVMSKGERYEGENVIDGVHYLSAYAPLAGDDGTITGMLFIAKSRAVVTNAVHQIVNLVIPIVTALVIVLMIIAGLFLRKFLKPLKGVKETLNDISSGDADLTKRITLKTHDEIGDVVTGFNTFSEKLQHIIGDVKSSKDDLVVAGEDLSGATQDTASSITQIITNIDSLRGQIDGQSQSVSQTAGAVNEIASNIESLDRMVSQQANDVTQASAAVEQMIGNISSVNASVDKMASSFGALQQNAQSGIGKQQAVNERIQQIEQQSAMLQEANAAISAIAEQTNLLAMNAAIEAAHAGDAGKGFSVVADEIRKLSETSTSQSKTIGDQLNNIKDSIAEVVSASADSSAAFESVSRLIKETDQLVTQIKSAMEEQQEGSQQITEALHSMNDSTVSVRNASNEMQEGNEMILKEVTQLQNASLAMTQRMEEMSIGARKINETGAALSDVANKISDSIQKIGVQVDQFKV